MAMASFFRQSEIIDDGAQTSSLEDSTISNDLNESFRIRKAVRSDMAKVLKMIQELATFEKLREEVKISVIELEKDCFDAKHPLFQCFVAEDIFSKLVIGYVVFYDTYSTWLGRSAFLEDLYVKPRFRGKGVGKSLFMAVAKYAYQNGSRLDFEVLSWNPAKEFYQHFGAVNLTVTETWQRMRLDREALSKLAKGEIQVE